MVGHIYGFLCICVCFMYLQKVICGVDASQIRGIGFDATCSLVVVDKKFQPLAVNSQGRTKSEMNCFLFGILTPNSFILDQRGCLLEVSAHFQFLGVSSSFILINHGFSCACEYLPTLA